MDRKNIILTFTASQWTSQPAAAARMAEVVHGQNVPITWQVSYAAAMEQLEQLTRWHEQYGDELSLILVGNETMDDWRKAFPWSLLNVIGYANNMTPQAYNEITSKGIEGVWGFCDQQIGPDGVTHWGCPWGMFYCSPNNPFIPAPAGQGELVGIPWVLRDLHKCYHLGQAINFSCDPHEHIHSKTLCTGKNITFFQDLLDELISNLPWNERIYACIHEETHGPYVPPGEELSGEGATREQGEAMYEMISNWLAYAKQQGVTITTIGQAARDYRKETAGTTRSSTLLTRDKHHGRIIHYVAPMPSGVPDHAFGPSGHFPDTLFHYDDECQLVFVHPETLPRQVLNYKEQYPRYQNRPYPREDVLPTLIDWKTEREGNIRRFVYQMQSWYAMPFGLAEWADFKGWRVVSHNGRWAKIIDDRLLFLRCDIAPCEGTSEEINAKSRDGQIFEVTLERME